MPFWLPVRMTLFEYTLLSFSSLFVITNPIGVVPAFLAMTPKDTPDQRIRMARLACFVTAGVMLLFALSGRLLFNLLGVTIPAFQIAGSVVLLLVALDMLQARRSAVQFTGEEADEGTAKEDIAITPLAVPMLAGPGAITTSVLLHQRAEGIAQHVALCLCIIVVSLTSYGIFALSAYGTRWLSPLLMRLATRLMGLLLASIAMQFLLNAMREIGLVTF